MIEIQFGLLDPDDFFLFGVEMSIVIGLVLALILAVLVHRHHSKTTSIGWGFIFLGLMFLLSHAIFDLLDTLQFDDLMVDLLNVFDGATFVVGLFLFAIGIYRIAEFGAKQWEV